MGKENQFTKPTLPQGTRDFGPDVVRKRQYILTTIKKVFELYGFEPLETPAMENLDTLMGKYGEEGDKLIFRVLDSGNPFSPKFFRNLSAYFKSNYENIEFLRTAEPVEFGNTENPFNLPIWNINPDILSDVSKELVRTKQTGQKFLSEFKDEVSSKALKYDLTIPFARYVAMNHGQLTFPFKRYQIQPVWRADRPQRGRYREFYQCDADVVGSKALLNEVELTNIYTTVFKALNIPVQVKLNSRKILAALAELCGGADKMIDITIAIDKLDKIGLDKVKAELVQRDITDKQVELIEQYLSISGSNDEKLTAVKNLFAGSITGQQGIAELEYILNNVTDPLITHHSLLIDLTLARGLNYYTGIIFEVKAIGVNMGSIGGGGRYDNLTGLFGVPDIPGVGISFGVDRIYDVLEDLKLFPETIAQGTKALFFNLGEEESKAAYTLLQQVRAAGTAAEIFGEALKFDKQFKYAEKKAIPFAVIVGSAEVAAQQAVVKDLRSGAQQKVSFADLPRFVFE